LLHDIGKVLTTSTTARTCSSASKSPQARRAPDGHQLQLPRITTNVAHESPISVIVQAADAVSGSRPGARRESVRDVREAAHPAEQIASEFAGVEKVFAIQAAGRCGSS